jgi:hypothetical protein
MPVTASNPIMAFSPSAQPGTSSSLKRTVIVLTVPFYFSRCLFLWFTIDISAPVKEKGPESFGFVAPGLRIGGYPMLLQVPRRALAA